MKKKILIALFFTLIIVFAIGTIQAKEFNATDIANSDEDNFLQIENKTSFNDLDSDLNKLSATCDDNSLKENNKNKTVFVAPSTSIYCKAPYCVTLKDSNSNRVLSNKSINLVINKVNYAATTDNNGIASVNLKLTPGKYTASAYFAGDGTYESCKLTSKFKVLPTIKAKNVSKYYNGSTNYSATFFDTKGNALANTAVTITVNGKSYSKKTDAKGIASMPINLKPGTYKVVSTNPITGYKLTTTFRILPTISSKNLKKIVGDNRKFTAKFFKSNGKALSNQFVKIKIDGKVHKVKTNSKGKAILSLKKLKKGTHALTCYNVDGLSKNYKVTVYKKASTKLVTNDYTFLPKEARVIKVKLLTSLDDYLISGRVIKVKINGKTFFKKTNGQGVISLKLSSLKKGLYTAEYEFEATKYFKASKAKNFVTIVGTAKTSLKVKSTKVFGYGAGTPLKVAYSAGGVPLAKKTVILKIDGKKYTKTTDNNGLVVLPINLKVGKYGVTYKTNDESKLNGTSGSFNIKIFKRTSPQIIWKSGNSYKDSSQTFKVLLTDLKGKPITGQKIKLTIGSKTFTATTSSKGYVKLKTYLTIGKYKVSVKYKGNNYYLKKSVSKSVNVKLSRLVSGVNEKNSVSYLSSYLKSSYHCPVGNSKIKAIVHSLTSGLRGDLNKAKAIFNYVRDKLEYSHYYDTRYGAVGTLTMKMGNCVDLSHLLVAMYRTAGLKARYVHGTCHFNKGYTLGHVWTQVLIGNTWVCGDASNNINAFGKINSWNVNSFSLHGRYSSLSF